MNLDDYLRLQELDRIEGEKKCLVCLKKIINICLKRNYTFSIHALRDDSSIDVTTDGWKSSYNAYFRAFESRFGCAPHTSECKNFVETYGKDYQL